MTLPMFQDPCLSAHLDSGHGVVIVPDFWLIMAWDMGNI